MPSGRVVSVDCQCGRPLFKYYKVGRGRLIKCYLEEIRQDYVGVLDDSSRLPERLTCPDCGKELGEIRIVRGRPALKLNQGAVRKVRL